jgi:hypothetical protein
MTVNNDRNKDLLKMLIKLNDSLLKDVAGTATSFNNNSSQNFWMNFTSSLNLGGEDESKDNYLEPSNFNYIFDILKQSLCVLYSSFLSIGEEVHMSSTANTNSNRVLGLKRVYQVEYFKSVLEIVLNANSSLNFQSSESLAKLIETTANLDFFSKTTVFCFVKKEFFFLFEWNNMFQKAYESIIVLAVNRFSPGKLISLLFEDLKILDLFISHIFEKNFTFE